MRLDPKLFNPHVNLGIVLAKQNQFAAAAAAYQEAIRLNPKYQPVYYSLGVVLAKQKRWREAIVARSISSREICLH